MEGEQKQSYAPNPEVERLIFIGAAGLLVGLIVGALAFRSGSEEPTPRTPSPEANAVGRDIPAKPTAEAQGDPAESPTAKDKTATDRTAKDRTAKDRDVTAEAPIDPLALEPEKRPEQIVEPPAAEEVSEALLNAVKADKWFKRTRVRLHKALGSGALVRSAGLTPAGKRIMARLGALGAHAINDTAYAIPTIESQLEDVQGLDAGGLAALETSLGKALLRLVMDFRLLKRAGPFELVSEKRLAGDPKRLKKLRRLAVDFVQAPSDEAAFAILDPPHPAYRPLLAALKTYRGFANAGGCQRLPKDWKIRPKDSGKRVSGVQRRLACEGLYHGPINGRYDDATLAAVEAYQRTHELDDDGFVFAGTIQSMNVTMSRRVAQIELALQRLRESKVWRMNQSFYLSINIPAFELRAVEDGQIVRRHKVIVGTNRLDDNKQELVQGHLNRTRVFTTQLYRAIINPGWILPERISKGELVGKIEADPGYLKRNNIHRQTLANGRTVLVQGFGATNVLGKVKFLLKRSNAVFLHDTDKRSMFRHTRRDFSHGCVRVHKAIEFAKWLLAHDGWDQREIARAFKLQKTQRGMDMHHPVDLMTEYLTVDVNAAGQPIFLTDIYKYDNAYFAHDLPPKWRIRWGAMQLRPGWVPQVPEATVNRWRREGKAAPRNYDPKKDG